MNIIQASPAARGHQRRICVALHDLRGGGAERACLRLARGMAAVNRDVDIVLVNGAGAYLSDIPESVDVTALNKRHVSGAVFALANYIRVTRPRAVLSALTHMNVAAILAARISGSETRVVVSERNQISEKSRLASGLRQRAVYSAVPWLYPAADAVVAVSGGVASDLRRFGKLPETKLHVIHNPVFDSDIEELGRQEPSHPWMHQNYPPVVLGAGRLHRQKGFDLLLRAFATVRAHISCRLIVLGEGPDRKNLLALARALGIENDVALPGFNGNPFAFMARAAAFVLPSRWEGFPNALVEAMACGAPVIAADCPSGPRDILDGGRFGRLVPPQSVEALAVAMIETLGRRPDTQLSRERAQEFSVAAATSRYLEVLEAAP